MVSSLQLQILPHLEIYNPLRALKETQEMMNVWMKAYLLMPIFILKIRIMKEKNFATILLSRKMRMVHRIINATKDSINGI